MHPLRLHLTVHYDGSEFHGWQFQPDRRTVQGELQSAVSRLADQPVSVTGSGRTDTGVHAVGQVAAVDLPERWTADELRRALNATLPGDVWIEAARRVASDFHPRFDAVARTYRYQVGTDPLARSPFHHRTCWPVSDALDRALLTAASETILGAHSFEAFAKAGQPERGYDCRVAAAQWTDGALGLRFEITADRYLHHMVRYLVGTMVDIARGRRPVKDMGLLLAKKADVTTSPPAPAEGLFLAHVEYPQSIEFVEPSPSVRSAATA